VTGSSFFPSYLFAVMEPTVLQQITEVREHVVKGFSDSVRWPMHGNVCAVVAEQTLHHAEAPSFPQTLEAQSTFINPLRQHEEEARQAAARLRDLELDAMEQEARRIRRLERALQSTARSNVLTRYLTEVKNQVGASAVYLAELRDAGTPTEHLYYFAASQNQQFMVGQVLHKGEGVAFNALQTEELEEAVATRWQPTPVMSQTPCANGRVVVLRDVMLGSTRFFGFPRPGHFVAVPVVFKSPLSPECLATVPGSLVDAFNKREKFEDDTGAAEARQREELRAREEQKARERERDEGRAKKSKKGREKSKQRVDEEQMEIEPLQPESLFQLHAHLKDVPETAVVKWVLCADTIGASFGDSMIDGHRELGDTHVAMLKDAADRLREVTLRQHRVVALRYRHLQTFQTRGVVPEILRELREVRDAKVAEIEPQEAPDRDSKADKKKDRRKAGADTEKKKDKKKKEKVVVELSEDDIQRIRLVHVESCSKINETLRWGLLTFCNHPAPSHRVLAVFDALFTALSYPPVMFRDAKAGKIDWRKARKLVNGSLLMRLEGMQVAAPWPLELTKLKQSCGNLVAQELESESVAAANLCEWLKYFAECREYLNVVWKRAEPVTDIRILKDVPKEREDETIFESESFAAGWLDKIVIDKTGLPADSAYTLEDLHFPVPKDGIPPREGQNLGPIVLVVGELNCPVNSPYQVGPEYLREDVKDWTEQGNHLVVFGDPDGAGVELLNRTFSWTLQPVYCKDLNCYIPSGGGHVLGLRQAAPAGNAHHGPVVAADGPRPPCFVASASLPPQAVVALEYSTVAAFGAPAGRGVVFVSSCHPTSPEGLAFLQGAIRAASQPAYWSVVNKLLKPVHEEKPDDIVAEGRQEAGSKPVVEEVMLSGKWHSQVSDQLLGLWAQFHVGLEDDVVTNFAAVVQDPGLSGIASPAMNMKHAKVRAGWWGSVLALESPQSQLTMELPARPPMMATTEIFAAIEAGELPAIDVDCGWTFGFWMRPMLRTTRNSQIVATVTCDGYMDCDLRLTVGDKLVFTSTGPNENEVKGAPETWESQMEGLDDVSDAQRQRMQNVRSGESLAPVDFGEWNFVVIQQAGLTRRLWLNAVEQKPCEHFIGVPSYVDFSKLPVGLEGRFGIHPPASVVVSPPGNPEKPAPQGCMTDFGFFDTTPGSGLVEWQGEVAEIYMWERVVEADTLKSLYEESRARNLWAVGGMEELMLVGLLGQSQHYESGVRDTLHQFPGTIEVRDILDTTPDVLEHFGLPETNCLVAVPGSLSGIGSRAQRVIADHIKRGGVLCAFVDTSSLEDVNSMFSWRLQPDELSGVATGEPRGDDEYVFFTDLQKEEYLAAQSMKAQHDVALPLVKNTLHPWCASFSDLPSNFLKPAQMARIPIPAFGKFSYLISDGASLTCTQALQDDTPSGIVNHLAATVGYDSLPFELSEVEESVDSASSPGGRRGQPSALRTIHLRYKTPGVVTAMARFIVDGSTPIEASRVEAGRSDVCEEQVIEVPGELEILGKMVTVDAGNTFVFAVDQELPGLADVVASLTAAEAYEDMPFTVWCEMGELVLATKPQCVATGSAPTLTVLDTGASISGAVKMVVGEGSAAHFASSCLPEGASVILGSGVVEAWTVEVGEGRVSYMGDHNFVEGSERQKLLRVLLRGRVGGDV